MSDFTRKPNRAKAIQFDGTNGKEVVDFAKELGATNISRGGGWVKVSDDNGSLVKLRRDDYLVFDSDESFRRYNEDEFFRYFRVYPATRGGTK